MNISYTKIDPAGNITVIVDSFVPREQQSRVASESRSAFSKSPMIPAAPCVFR